MPPRAKTTVPEAAFKVQLSVLLIAIHFFTWQKVSVSLARLNSIHQDFFILAESSMLSPDELVSL